VIQRKLSTRYYHKDNVISAIAAKELKGVGIIKRYWYLDSGWNIAISISGYSNWCPWF